MLSILATIFFSATLLAAAAVLLAALDEARGVFAELAGRPAIRTDPRRRAVAISRSARFARTPLRAAA